MLSSASSAFNKLDADNNYMELYLNNSKRLMGSKESNSSASPPSYAVFEDEHGNLVNRVHNVIWPARPHRGRYSLKEYNEQKQRLRKHVEQRQLNKKCKKRAKQSERQPDVSYAHASEQTNDSNNIYIGVQSATSLRSILQPTEFRLFYIRPESMNTFDQMPVKMPLMLAYMSSSGKMYHFSFKRHEYTSGIFWQLDLSGIQGPKQPMFRSISALIQHYKSFIIDRGDGKSEIFPVD
ncbi:unnamed protein product [Cercopithifilaria johnstoni]|uniref:SH2 domain-containing protein n=1 Tax=Cercopithifilaria johnstoni TaxID=2874296 RepID=A0A8J2MGL8_9BILA|nr:unnamed protein product [Cercopithifilaria johnstoni]